MQNPDDIAKDVSDVGQDLADQAVSAAGDVAEASQDAMSEAKEAVGAAVVTATEGVDLPPATVPPVPPPPPVVASTYAAAPGARPGGIAVLGIVGILWGGVKLLWGLGILGLGTVVGVASAVFGDSTWALAGSGFGHVITGIAWLAAGIGMLTLKPWAWLLALIVVGINVLGALWGMVTGNLLCGLTDLILPAVLLFYLTRPHVRAAFGK